ncbi:hypothetical protein [Trebonia sp.]|uniref:COG4315 family predicted lipoprotein n=1 Tax=Trebonia sp. TaxID=2767075 RepID=UPI0026120233|nr:hypothetical protein [Trebonia sp.]
MTAAARAALACAAAAVLATSCGSAAASGPPAYEVRATTIGGLGQILADGAGRTLYLYTPDKQGPSVCSPACLIGWPPLVLPKGVTKPLAGPGINPALLGTDRRPDGELQVTYDKWPLYLFTGDYGPGQANGQADAMGLWWVVSVSGAIDRGVVS